VQIAYISYSDTHHARFLKIPRTIMKWEELMGMEKKGQKSVLKTSVTLGKV